MNRTRQLYNKILRGVKPDIIGDGEKIAAANELKSLLTHPGYRRVQKFIDTQKLGSSQYVEKETRSINLFSFPWLFNTFIKWLAIMLENRAYNRIDTYIKVTIKRGEEAEERVAKEEARAKAQQQNEQQQ